MRVVWLWYLCLCSECYYACIRLGDCAVMSWSQSVQGGSVCPLHTAPSQPAPATQRPVTQLDADIIREIGGQEERRVMVWASRRGSGNYGDLQSAWCPCDPLFSLTKESKVTAAVAWCLRCVRNIKSEKSRLSVESMFCAEMLHKMKWEKC